MPHTVGTVSYTHLDVYKRQVGLFSRVLFFAQTLLTFRSSDTLNNVKWQQTCDRYWRLWNDRILSWARAMGPWAFTNHTRPRSAGRRILRVAREIKNTARPKCNRLITVHGRGMRARCCLPSRNRF